jgi:hypothetical protein
MGIGIAGGLFLASFDQINREKFKFLAGLPFRRFALFFFHGGPAAEHAVAGGMFPELVQGFGQGVEVVEKFGNGREFGVRLGSFLFLVPGAADKYFPELRVYGIGAVA